jgi:hypothetical protein
MGRCNPGDQILLKNSKCSESLQIERERRSHHYKPNATHLGSNGRWEREISRSVQNDKQAKKRDADCTVRTVHTDADVACPYETCQRWIGRTIKQVAFIG